MGSKVLWGANNAPIVNGTGEKPEQLENLEQPFKPVI